MSMLNRRQTVALGVFATSPLALIAQVEKSSALNYEVQLARGFEGANLFVPQKSMPSGAVLFLHGSEGGLNGNFIWLAHWLASYGFLTMALPYSVGGNVWHAGDIIKVPLERTLSAMDWLRGHPKSNGKLGICGYSRGAEHALLMASLIARDLPEKQPNAIAAHAGTDVVARDFYSAAVLPRDARDWPSPQPSWIWRGNEIARDQVIEIDRSSASIFLSHGEKDTVWNVQKTRNLEKRLRDAGKNPTVRYYPDQGHGLNHEKRNEQMMEWRQFFAQHLG